MITKIYLNNYSTFNKEIELDMEPDNRIKQFPDNISNESTLKSAVIYGPNNTGKTAIINGIKCIKSILLNEETLIVPNLFTINKISKFKIVFNLNNKTYKYEFWRHLNDGIVYEAFYNISEKEELVLLKDSINKIYKCSKDNNLKKAIENSSTNSILIYTINTENFEILSEIKRILTEIANKIVIIDMNNLPLDKTIALLKNKNNIASKVVDFIKCANLFLDDYYYSEDGNELSEFYLKNVKAPKDEKFIDQIKMVSSYKGVSMPSILFDSLGTRKIASLASYIIEALEEGKILIIDELDSSLHFKLTRAIIALFNNELNKKAQIICTLHDISLLDCKRLFRKDQIWFTSKDANGSKLYSLKDFSYYKDGIRETSDIIEKYSKGLLGAIPEPDLISILLENDDEI